jgi:hypothetical protein
MGGEYVEGNVISVEVTSCNKQTANHVMWHYANWQLWGKREDFLAWRGLSGYYSKEELISVTNSLGGEITGRKLRDSGFIQALGKKYGTIAMSPGGWLYENRVDYARKGYEAGISKPENRLSHDERVSLAKRIYSEGKGLASLTTEQRQEIGKRAGKINGLKNKENKIGVCGIPPEEHSKRMSLTNKQRWQCPDCGHVSNAKNVNKHMLEKHNLPKSAKLRLEGKTN